uniref:Leucine-rich repeat-containing protein 27 n=2 Tax=Ciona intestinalis TaxID=7719 RepID=A0A1W3JDM4_CIOIN|nr:leucine-rich repeat-containing protein 27 isoform X1 [Ciona intestinalis]XP_009859355.1 leucine-rich repeat-containing protein 27 isoform X2 [Ciona intestinalis]|eukprot:XP_002130075.1 leucine-rich repeat-containing protein 27 isoform X1 [Ciona intestinalis]
MHSFDNSEPGRTTVNKKLGNKDNEVVKLIKNQSHDDAFLDLCNRGIQILPDQLYTLPHIQHLYLEGNQISQLPNNFFDRLPTLQWLDLRNNQLKAIPVSIGRHQSIKKLLLEGNCLTHLPLQMGLTKTLTGLNLRGNPLVVPPQHITDQGVYVILSYLWQELQNRTKTPYDEVSPAVEKLSIIDDESNNSEEDEDMLTDAAIFTGRNIPSPLSDDFELVRHGPTPMSASLHKPVSYQEYKGRFQGNSLLEGLRNKSRNSPKEISLVDIHHKDDVRKDQLRQMREMKQMNEDQRRKDKTVLSNWRHETRRRQRQSRSKTADVSIRPPPFASDEQLVIHSDVREEKVETVLPGEHKLRVKHTVPIKRSHMIVEIPNAMNEVNQTESVDEEKKEDKNEPFVGKMSRPNSVARSRTNDEIMQRMKQHSSQLHKQFKKQRKEVSSTAPSKELQRELLDRKMSKDPQLEYRFRAFTGDTASAHSSSNKTTSM